MTMARWIVTACVLSFASGTAATITRGAQDPQASSGVEARIVSPGPATYITGPTRLQGLVDPPAKASSVSFSVDGKFVCTVHRPPFACDWDAGGSVTEHQVRMVVELADGGRLIRTVRTKSIGYAESVDVKVVQVSVTVTDGRGHYVTDLPADAFHVYENDRPQSITHFESENVPLDLVLALDASSSMTPSSPTLKAAVKDFLFAVPADANVSVLGFNDDVFTLIPRGTSREAWGTRIDRISTWGRTALYDAIVRGVELLDRSGTRNALILFTDGEDQGSHATVDDVRRRLEASDVTLYIIGQGRATSMNSLKQTIERLCEPTGGRALFKERISDLHTQFEDLLEELSNQYLLGYVPSETGAGAGLRRIRVEVDGYRHVRARRGYDPGAAR